MQKSGRLRLTCRSHIPWNVSCMVEENVVSFCGMFCQCWQEHAHASSNAVTFVVLNKKYCAKRAKCWNSHFSFLQNFSKILKLTRIARWSIFVEYLSWPLVCSNFDSLTRLTLLPLLIAVIICTYSAPQNNSEPLLSHSPLSIKSLRPRDLIHSFSWI